MTGIVAGALYGLINVLTAIAFVGAEDVSCAIDFDTGKGIRHVQAHQLFVSIEEDHIVFIRWVQLGTFIPALFTQPYQ